MHRRRLSSVFIWLLALELVNKFNLARAGLVNTILIRIFMPFNERDGKSCSSLKTFMLALTSVL